MRRRIFQKKKATLGL